MSTVIRTIKGTAYTVDSLSIPLHGPAAIIVRQPSGKKRRLSVQDVGRPRFVEAVTHYFAEERAASILRWAGVKARIDEVS